MATGVGRMLAGTVPHLMVTDPPYGVSYESAENNSEEGDCVYEPLSGSGTTLIAAERSGRCCFALELDPRYIDVAVTRWRRP